MEKIIHGVEFPNPHENSIEKNPEIIETIEKNYKTIKRVNQYLFPRLLIFFFKYTHSLDPNEIQQLGDDIKSNGWGLLEIDNSVELLSTFQVFDHNHCRLHLTNGLLIVPDSEMPERGE